MILKREFNKFAITIAQDARFSRYCGNIANDELNSLMLIPGSCVGIGIGSDGLMGPRVWPHSNRTTSLANADAMVVVAKSKLQIQIYKILFILFSSCCKTPKWRSMILACLFIPYLTWINKTKKSFDFNLSP
jgi:hypothetical protein